MSTKLVLPLLVVLPDKPGNPVTPITAGYTTYTCFYGDCYQVKLPALGHDDVLVGQSGMMYKTFKFQQKAKSIHTLYGYKK